MKNCKLKIIIETDFEIDENSLAFKVKNSEITVDEKDKFPQSFYDSKKEITELGSSVIITTLLNEVAKTYEVVLKEQGDDAANNVVIFINNVQQHLFHEVIKSHLKSQEKVG